MSASAALMTRVMVPAEANVVVDSAAADPAVVEVAADLAAAGAEKNPLIAGVAMDLMAATNAVLNAVTDLVVAAAVNVVTDPVVVAADAAANPAAAEIATGGG